MPIEPLTTRSGKGSALTHPEADANWETLEDFCNALEDRMDVSLNSDGSIKTEKVPYAATTVGSDAYAVTVGGTVAAVTDLTGRVILVKIDVANTGAATLNVNGLGATSILRSGGLALRSGDLKAGIAALALYPSGSPYFVLLNPGTGTLDNYSTTTNSGNSYIVTVADLNASAFEVPAAYYAGYTLKVKFNALNTGSAQIKVVSTTPSIDLGYVTIYNGSSTLAGSELKTDRIYTLVHDGTYFQIQLPAQTFSLVVQDAKATTTDGGTFTQGAWRTRTLQTTVHNSISGATLVANQISLPAGSYRVDAWAVGHEVLSHQIRVRNVTAGTTVAVGSNIKSTAASNVGAISQVSGGRFTLTTTSLIELQHYCEQTKATDGFGRANSFGENEVYANVEIYQE